MRLSRYWLLGSLLLAMLTLTRPALAWHAAGHQATAWIAYLTLGKEKAHKVADVLRKHPDYALWMKDKSSDLEEDLYLFLHAATWPDDIRDKDHPSHKLAHSSWHYINRFFTLDGKTPPTPEKGKHIQEAFELNSKALSGSGSDADKAVALCWVFHLMGDIHQPLHTTALVSTNFPEGDRGGNLFWVQRKKGTTNLHNLWDGFWDKETAVKRASDAPPTERVDHLKLQKIVDGVKAQYPASGFKELGVTDFNAWIDEGYAFATHNAYLDGKLQGNSDKTMAVALPDTYEADSRKLGERQLALGGYRLAGQLTSLLKL